MPKTDRFPLPALPLWGLLTTLVALFLLGGSSRLDVQSLAFLNPILIVCCAGALSTLKRDHIISKIWLLAGFVFVFSLLAIYVAPLPTAFAMLSGDEYYLYVIRTIANVPTSSHYLAIGPGTAWQSFFFLFGPLAVLLFAIQLNREGLKMALLLVIGIGAASGVIGVLQLAGSLNGPLYFYRITNNGSAVGLFANRNHAAVFLSFIFPMLAVVTTNAQATSRWDQTSLQWVALAISVLTFLLILVTGSRSGMLSAFIGLTGGALIYLSHSRARRVPDKGKSKTLITAVTVVLGLVFLTIYFSRAETLDRLFAEPNEAYGRVDFWITGVQIFCRYLPFGFGPGGFVSAFQIEEPLDLLGGAYLNRLHNDWFETALAFGVLGILLMLAGTVCYLRRSFVLWFRMDGGNAAVVLGRMGSILIGILLAASLSDYPLRTPAMAGFFALALVWFSHARHDALPS